MSHRLAAFVLSSLLILSTLAVAQTDVRNMPDEDDVALARAGLRHLIDDSFRGQIEFEFTMVDVTKSPAAPRVQRAQLYLAGRNVRMDLWLSDSVMDPMITAVLPGRAWYTHGQSGMVHASPYPTIDVAQAESWLTQLIYMAQQTTTWADVLRSQLLSKAVLGPLRDVERRDDVLVVTLDDFDYKNDPTPAVVHLAMVPQVGHYLPVRVEWTMSVLTLEDYFLLPGGRPMSRLIASTPTAETGERLIWRVTGAKAMSDAELFDLLREPYGFEDLNRFGWPLAGTEAYDKEGKASFVPLFK